MQIMCISSHPSYDIHYINRDVFYFRFFEIEPNARQVFVKENVMRAQTPTGMSVAKQMSIVHGVDMMVNFAYDVPTLAVQLDYLARKHANMEGLEPEHFDVSSFFS